MSESFILNKQLKEIRVKEYIEYNVGWFECPKCGMKLNLYHRETPHRKKASHRVERRVE